VTDRKTVKRKCEGGGDVVQEWAFYYSQRREP